MGDCCSACEFQLSMVCIHAAVDNAFHDYIHEAEWLALAMAGEAGEAANAVKKLRRDGDTPSRVKSVVDELGDVLVYLVLLSHHLGTDFGDLIQRAERLATKWASDRDLMERANEIKERVKSDGSYEWLRW